MPEHRWIKYSLLTLSILGPCLILAIAIRKKMSKRNRFISEDDLETFDGFLRYHVIDPSMTSPDELQKWRELFDEARDPDHSSAVCSSGFGAQVRGPAKPAIQQSPVQFICLRL